MLSKLAEIQEILTGILAFPAWVKKYVIILLSIFNYQSWVWKFSFSSYVFILRTVLRIMSVKDLIFQLFFLLQSKDYHDTFCC